MCAYPSLCCRIIVGAPKGTYPGGLALPASADAENETGLVYQCSLTDEACSAVGRDGSNPANDRLFDSQRKLSVCSSVVLQ